MKPEITVKGKPHRNSYEGGFRRCGFCGTNNWIDEKTKYTKGGKPKCVECLRPTLRNRPRNSKKAEKTKQRKLEIKN